MRRAVFIFFTMMAFKAEAQTSVLKVADSLYALGSYAKAINEYSKEGSEASKLQIARAYNAIGNYEKAVVQYENSIAISPESQLTRFELGKLHLKLNNPQDASRLFHDLILDGTKNPEYSYYFGLALAELKNNKESILAFKSAVEIDSTHLRSIFQLGKYYVTKQERDSALFYLDKGLGFYPDDVTLINLKALALFNNAEYKNAVPYFERLLDLGEEKPHIYEKLGHCYNKLWEFDKAKESYSDLLNYEEFLSNAYNGLGAVYWKEKKLDSAAIFFKKAIEAKKPNLEGEYTSLAGLAREANDLKSALKYYRLAFHEDKTNFMTYYQICTVLDQLSEDAKIKLKQYESFIEKFGPKKPYMSDFVLRRISELKEEIHFAKD